MPRWKECKWALKARGQAPRGGQARSTGGGWKELPCQNDSGGYEAFQLGDDYFL